MLTLIAMQTPKNNNENCFEFIYRLNILLQFLVYLKADFFYPVTLLSNQLERFEQFC